jgi:hypothetical protein
MRATVGLIAVSGLCFSQAFAQDALTYDFGGRVGIGWLNQETVDPDGRGFTYDGLVVALNATGSLEFGIADDFSVGAIARLSLEKGEHSTYDRWDSSSGPARMGHEFGTSEVDLAAYVTAHQLTVSYGDMETAFDHATLEVQHGNSVIDGGNALWMNIGDAAGSLGLRNNVDTGQWRPDFKTLRADIAVGEFTFSASTSKAATLFGTTIKAEAAGLVWQRQDEQGSIRVGAGWDHGPEDRFSSLSVGLQRGGFDFVLSRIHRDPLDNRPGTRAAYDTTFTGMSLSYDFGGYSLGFARSEQYVNPRGDQVYAGKAHAVWASWITPNNVSVNFELSKNDYNYASYRETRKASLSIALEF